MPATAKPRILERDIEKGIRTVLELDNWHVIKTDPCRNREWGKGFGELGMADLLAIRYTNLEFTPPRGSLADVHARVNGQVLWVEGKRPGGKAAPHQKLWHAAERERGALTLIAGEDFEASAEGFLTWYRASGLMRREIS